MPEYSLMGKKSELLNVAVKICAITIEMEQQYTTYYFEDHTKYNTIFNTQLHIKLIMNLKLSFM
jgi:hypothetical protein